MKGPTAPAVIDLRGVRCRAHDLSDHVEGRLTRPDEELINDCEQLIRSRDQGISIRAHLRHARIVRESS